MEPKAFQRNSIEHIIKEYNGGKKCILLADEVGLGKTIVARGVIEKLQFLKEKRGGNQPLKVCYVCGNQSLALANAEKLVNNYEKKEETVKLLYTDNNGQKHSKSINIDRLSLQFLKHQVSDKVLNYKSNHTVQLECMTPRTSLAYEHSGTKQERLILCAIWKQLELFSVIRNCGQQYNQVVAKVNVDNLLSVYAGNKKGVNTQEELNLYIQDINLYEEYIKSYLFKENSDKTEFAESIINNFKKRVEQFYFIDHVRVAQLKQFLNQQGVNKTQIAHEVYLCFEKLNDKYNFYHLFKNNLADNTIRGQISEKVTKPKESYNNIDANIRQEIENFFTTQGYNLYTSAISYIQKNESNIDWSNQSFPTGKIVEAVAYEYIRLRYGDNWEGQKTQISQPSFYFENGALKRAMAFLKQAIFLADIDAMSPDLVIVDEIQNYSNLFREETADNEMCLIISYLLHNKNPKQKILLMSATPFKYTTRIGDIEYYQNKWNEGDTKISTGDDSLDVELYNMFRYMAEINGKKWFLKLWDKNNKCIQVAMKDKADFGKVNSFIQKQNERIRNVGIIRTERYYDLSDDTKSENSDNTEIKDYMDNITYAEVIENDWSQPVYSSITDNEIENSFSDILEQCKANPGEVYLDIVLSISADYKFVLFNKGEKGYVVSEYIGSYKTLSKEYYDINNGKHVCLKAPGGYKLIKKLPLDDFQNVFRLSWENYQWNIVDISTKKLDMAKKMTIPSMPLDLRKANPYFYSFVFGMNEKQYSRTKRILLDSVNVGSLNRKYNPYYMINEKERQDGQVLNSHHAKYEKLQELLEEHCGNLLFLPPTMPHYDLEGDFEKYNDTYPRPSKTLIFSQYASTPQAIGFLLCHNMKAKRNKECEEYINEHISGIPDAAVIISDIMNKIGNEMPENWWGNLKKDNPNSTRSGNLRYYFYNMNNILLNNNEWSETGIENLDNKIKNICKSIYKLFYTDYAKYVIIRNLFQLKKSYDEVKDWEEEDWKREYWQTLLQYLKQGNIFAVLDEYIFMYLTDKQLIPDFGKGEHASGDITEIFDKLKETFSGIQEMQSTLQIKLFTYDEKEKKKKEVKLTSDEKEKKDVKLMIESNHKDEKQIEYMESVYAGAYWGEKPKKDKEETSTYFNHLLEVFKSPFLPFAFVTTSIGQEGFDFHWYCNNLVQWKMEYNPVRYEQRDGRVNRFRSHYIRQNVVQYVSQYVKRENKKWMPQSIKDWVDVFKKMEEIFKTYNIDTQSGIFPDWGCDWKALEEKTRIKFESERISRQALYYPDSKEENYHSRLIQTLNTYRAILGRTNQGEYEEILWEYVNFIQKQNQGKKPDISKLFLDLRPPQV